MWVSTYLLFLPLSNTSFAKTSAVASSYQNWLSCYGSVVGGEENCGGRECLGKRKVLKKTEMKVFGIWMKDLFCCTIYSQEGCPQEECTNYPLFADSLCPLTHKHRTCWEELILTHAQTPLHHKLSGSNRPWIYLTMWLGVYVWLADCRLS